MAGLILFSFLALDVHYGTAPPGHGASLGIGFVLDGRRAVRSLPGLGGVWYGELGIASP